jgi:hypothetical protein
MIATAIERLTSALVVRLERALRADDPRQNRGQPFGSQTDDVRCFFAMNGRTLVDREDRAQPRRAAAEPTP